MDQADGACPNDDELSRFWIMSAEGADRAGTRAD